MTNTVFGVTKPAANNSAQIVTSKESGATTTDKELKGVSQATLMTQQQLFAKRRRARTFALQTLYSMQLSSRGHVEVIAEYESTFLMHKADLDYYRELVSQTAEYRQQLDEKIDAFADRPVRTITPIELMCLRLASYELQYRLDIPAKVVIQEGVNLAYRFGADKSHKYVNAILDKMARQIRPAEFSTKKAAS